MFTEKNKDQAITMEKMVMKALALEFKEQNEKATEHIKKSKMDSVEDFMNAMGELETTSKNLKLLEDIENGKYRLLFMALSKGMDDFIHYDMMDYLKRAKEESENGEDN